MTNAQIRLLFAGILALASITATFAICFAGIIQGLATEQIVATTSPFSGVTLAAVTFFLGHQNGLSEVNEKSAAAADVVVQAAASATKIVADAAAVATRLASAEAAAATKHVAADAADAAAKVVDTAAAAAPRPPGPLGKEEGP